MQAFGQSSQFNEYMNFVGLMQNSVASKPISATAPKSAASNNQFIVKFKALMVELSDLCESTPLGPKESARFGNPAFKIWYTSAIEVIIY